MWERVHTLERLESYCPHTHTYSASRQFSCPAAWALFPPSPLSSILYPQEALQRLVNLYGLLHGLQVSGAGASIGKGRSQSRAAPGGQSFQLAFLHLVPVGAPQEF